MISAGIRATALSVSLLALALVAEAQPQPGKLPRIGVLTFTEMTPTLQDAFRQGLRDHGYVEGQNVLVEWRAAGGQPDRARTMARELVQLKVDVIVANLTPAVQAAKDATSAIPIVMAAAGDPVRTGFVTSLAHPGGNITGLTGISAELAGKRLELLREMVPGLTRVGLLVNASNPFARSLIDETQTAARTAGVHLALADVRRPQELEAAVAGMARQRVAAVIVDAALTSWRAAELVSQHRLPSVSNQRNFVDAGGLIFHGAQTADLHRRAAAYVDRILKGTKPAQLPVERPTKFELVINLKTARTLGLAIPPSLLVRADQVIE